MYADNTSLVLASMTLNMTKTVVSLCLCIETERYHNFWKVPLTINENAIEQVSSTKSLGAGLC